MSAWLQLLLSAHYAECTCVTALLKSFQFSKFTWLSIMVKSIFVSLPSS